MGGVTWYLCHVVFGILEWKEGSKHLWILCAGLELGDFKRVNSQ